MAGQIVIVNGTSGSGKSTTCELLVKRSSQFWLLYGIDQFVSGTFPAIFGHHGPRAQEGIYAHPVNENDPKSPLRWSFGENGTRAFAVLHEWVAAASRQGCNIVLDHLVMSDPPVLQDLIWRLQGLPALLVTLKPPYEVLLERVANRKMDKKMPTDLLGEDTVRKIIERLDRLRPWFYESVYANEISDLTVDTAVHGPEEVCAMIEARLTQGPGEAFDKLRACWPRPKPHATQH
jgi:chloramphenicol 3-O-phosphotransferase